MILHRARREDLISRAVMRTLDRGWGRLAIWTRIRVLRGVVGGQNEETYFEWFGGTPDGFRKPSSLCRLGRKTQATNPTAAVR